MLAIFPAFSVKIGGGLTEVRGEGPEIWCKPVCWSSTLYCAKAQCAASASGICGLGPVVARIPVVYLFSRTCNGGETGLVQTRAFSLSFHALLQGRPPPMLGRESPFLKCTVGLFRDSKATVCFPVCFFTPLSIEHSRRTATSTFPWVSGGICVFFVQRASSSTHY
eukprot:RCo002944